MEPKAGLPRTGPRGRGKRAAGVCGGTDTASPASRGCLYRGTPGGNVQDSRHSAKMRQLNLSENCLDALGDPVPRRVPLDVATYRWKIGESPLGHHASSRGKMDGCDILEMLTACSHLTALSVW